MRNDRYASLCSYMHNDMHCGRGLPRALRRYARCGCPVTVLVVFAVLYPGSSSPSCPARERSLQDPRQAVLPERIPKQPVLPEGSRGYSDNEPNRPEAAIEAALARPRPVTGYRRRRRRRRRVLCIPPVSHPAPPAPPREPS